MICVTTVPNSNAHDIHDVDVINDTSILVDYGDGLDLSTKLNLKYCLRKIGFAVFNKPITS